MRNYQTVGGLPYVTWQEFVAEFVEEFCPKNEVLTSRTHLETSRYFQGARNVDEYVDEFRETVERARYFEGAQIVMKFRQGLNPRIQDYVACLTNGRPSDDNPKEWYAAAILCDENRIANEAFKASSRIAPRSDTLSPSTGVFRRMPPRVANTAPPLSRFAPSISTPSHPSLPSAPTPTKANATATSVCFRCGEPGHSRKDCPKRFDIRYMELHERQAIVEDACAALDVAEAEERALSIPEDDEVPGFGRDSE
jgi:hypothetical protein